MTYLAVYQPQKCSPKDSLKQLQTLHLRILIQEHSLRIHPMTLKLFIDSKKENRNIVLFCSTDNSRLYSTHKNLLIHEQIHICRIDK